MCSCPDIGECLSPIKTDHANVQRVPRHDYSLKYAYWQAYFSPGTAIAATQVATGAMLDGTSEERIMGA